MCAGRGVSLHRYTTNYWPGYIPQRVQSFLQICVPGYSLSKRCRLNADILYNAKEKQKSFLARPLTLILLTWRPGYFHSYKNRISVTQNHLSERKCVLIQVEHHYPLTSLSNHFTRSKKNTSENYFPCSEWMETVFYL